MHHRRAVHLLKKQWRLLVIVGIILAGISGVVSALLPLEYRAEADVLVISKSRYGVDPYTIVKSAERVGENLAEIMKTDDFFEKVLEGYGQQIDVSPFENVADRVRRRRWSQSVQGEVVYGTSVLKVRTYHTDPGSASALADAAAGTLASRGWEYVGGDVDIRVVNNPAVSRYPVRPNILLNILGGFVVGVLLMGVLILRRS